MPLPVAAGKDDFNQINDQQLSAVNDSKIKTQKEMNTAVINSGRHQNEEEKLKVVMYESSDQGKEQLRADALQGESDKQKEQLAACVTGDFCGQRAADSVDQINTAEPEEQEQIHLALGELLSLVVRQVPTKFK
jgi:hypothetical protein